MSAAATNAARRKRLSMSSFLARTDETPMRARSVVVPERERDPDVGAALRPVGGVGGTVVRSRDRGDDRQPKSASRAAACAVGAAEAVERVLEEVVRNARALVEHVQLERAVGRSRAERDRSAAVAERVVDQVAERLLDAEPVECGDERRARGGGDLARVVPGLVLE